MMPIVFILAVLGAVLMADPISTQDTRISHSSRSSLEMWAGDKDKAQDVVGLRPVWPIPSQRIRCSMTTCCYRPRVCCMGGKWCCYELAPFLKAASC